VSLLIGIDVSIIASMPNQSAVQETNLNRTITWLHVSDFHFKSCDNWQRDVVLQSLQRLIVEEFPKQGIFPDLVFVSGDVAFSGQEAEYKVAEEFFRSMARDLNLPPEERWFVVPGNHDVDRASVNVLYKGMREQLADEKTAAELLGRESTWRTFAERQRAFFRFQEVFLGEDRAWKDDAPWKSELMEVRGFRVAVCGLNTAWACQDNEDEGKILIGEKQVRDALAGADELVPDVTIAIHHHPLDDLVSFDGRKARSLLESAGIFRLRGHLHEADLGMNVNPDAQSYEFAAGACWQGADQPHAVLATRLDFAAGEGSIFVWSYSPRGRGFWAPDNHLFKNMKNGRWDFIFRGRQRPSSSRPEAPAALVPDAYRRHLAGECADVDTLVDVDAPLHLRLQQVYVPLDTNWNAPKDTEAETDVDEEGARMAEQQARRPLAGLLEEEERRHFLAAGDPGSGKSTFARYSALSLLNGGEPRLPLFLRLQDFGEWLADVKDVKGRRLVEWAGDRLAEHGLDAEGIESRSGEGEVVWLLDGLDEIFDEAVRLRAAKIVGAWFEQGGSPDRVIVTTRPHAARQEGIVATLRMKEATAEVLPLTVDQQRAFLDKWFCAVHGRDGHDKAIAVSRTLWETMEQHERVDELRDNPLMLSTIAAMYHQGRVLPDHRVELYENAVKILLTKSFGPQTGGNPERVTRIWRGLMEVARGMQQRGKAREIGELDFKKHLRTGYFKNRAADPEDEVELVSFIDTLSSRSGLLRALGNPLRYAFYHLGFQEFLAARAYGEEPEAFEQLKSHQEDGAWREVILLTASYLFLKSAGGLGEQFLQRLWIASNDGTDSARLDLALLAAAEAPGATLPAAFLSDLRTAGCAALERRDWPPQERTTAGLSLGRLGDPRLGMEKEDRWVSLKEGSFDMGSEGYGPIHEVEISQPFKLGRYPVTNVEYRRFLEDGGYDREELWGEEGWEWRHLEGAEFETWSKARNLRSYEDELSVPGNEPKFWRDASYNAPNQPAVGVSWFEAEAYCNWLNRRMEETTPDWWKPGMRITLPSEAQWEYAARGAEGRTYPWGDQEPDPQRANYHDTKLSTTSPVGAFPAGSTPEGLADMAGNVWEWCLDVWDAEANEKREDSVADPVSEGGDSARRVVRGGSWIYQAQFLAGAFRSRVGTGCRFQSGGFRCCVSVSAEHG
jgi:formylglycine-generating enzyme required for sulfatase activity